MPKIGGAFGIGYYLQHKLSDDSGTDVPLVSLRALNLYGRYLWESGGKISFQGITIFVGFTVAGPKV